MAQKLFRDSKGDIKPMLTGIEGFNFRESPLDFFIMLARYKFAARFIEKQHEVIDVGCGHGQGSIFLSRFAKQVTATDFDAEHIKKNQKEHAEIKNLSFQTLDLLNLRPQKKKFDVLVSMDVIEHFTSQQVDKVARNYAALVKEKGFAIIGTPNIKSQPYASERRLKSHLHEFEAKEFKELLSKHFRQVFLFSMTDEVVSTSFAPMAWYLMAICTK